MDEEWQKQAIALMQQMHVRLGEMNVRLAVTHFIVGKLLASHFSKSPAPLQALNRFKGLILDVHDHESLWPADDPETAEINHLQIGEYEKIFAAAEKALQNGDPFFK